MTLDKLTSALNKGGQHLGDLIWWTLAEARIDRSTLENIWAGAQLAPEYLPDPPTAEKALKSAVREAALGQPDRLIRLGKEDEAEIIFAVVRETKHDRRLDHLPAGDPRHPRPAGRVRLLRRPWPRPRRRHHHPVRRASLHPHGRRRPSIHDEGPRRLRGRDAARPRWRLLGAARPTRRPSGASRAPSRRSAAPGSTCCRFTRAPTPARPSGDAAKVAIEDELAALKAEVEGFMASPPDRPSTLVRRLDAFEGLQAGPTSTGTCSRSMSRISRPRSPASPPPSRPC